jgi:cob(I)alamin adenosyltransferase
MLYTRKGDNGTTSALNTPKGERRSKSSCQTESLGALDELNSFLGMAKIKTRNKETAQVVAWVQDCLFTVQAEVAGAEKTITAEKITAIESRIDQIEKALPPIKTFFISGGTEMAVIFDISRTLARKAERRVIAAVEEGEIKVGADTLAFLNRLSSLFYAYARLCNHKSGIKEVPPSYS